MTSRLVPSIARGALVGCMLLATLIGAAGSADAADGEVVAKPPPVEAFFRNPDLREAKLSPSGRWLGITTATASGRVVLAVVDLEDAAAGSKVLVSYTNVDIRSFDWVNDERLVYNTIDLDATPKEQVFGPGLFSIRRDGAEQRTLIRPRQVAFVSRPATTGVPPLEPDHGLLTVLRDGSNDVVVGRLRVDIVGEPQSITPLRLDVVTGRAVSLAAGAPPHVTGWLFDDRGMPRIATSQHAGSSEIFWRPSIDAPWTSLARFASNAAPFVPLAVDHPGNLYVATIDQGGTGALKRFDFTTGKPEADAIVTTAGFSFEGDPVFDDTATRLLGVHYEIDARSTVWFDPAMKQLQQMVDRRLPAHTNRLVCRRCAGDGVLMVHSFSDQDPGSYWIYRASTQSWDPIGRVRKDIDPAQMAQLDLFRFKARDGLEIPVWVTTPRGPKRARPAVVLVHGGPWIRGVHWQWDSSAQFLASRGYVVIEPEFRGSTGYGRALYARGFKQWGLAMQDDLADAVQWAAARGAIDPQRVCIAGASYGGYAALMGLVRQPELYRCGVAWVAVTDPRLLLAESWFSDATREIREFSLPVLVGDPGEDAAMLKDAAPIEHAAEIKAPLLMAFGSVDRRVPIEHGTRLNAAMRAAGLHPDYVVYDGEGHGWQKVENRVDWWQRVERFLAVQLH